MINLLLANWWIALPIVGVVLFWGLRFWARRKFDFLVQDILSEAQAGFAKGAVNIHSVEFVGTTEVQDETATLYDIEATITPTSEQHEWAAADLFLYGIDEDGDEDCARIGEVRKVQQWSGLTFESIKRGAKHNGEQRLKLTIRFAGAPGLVRFNYNFACFGQAFDLPSADAALQATS